MPRKKTKKTSERSIRRRYEDVKLLYHKVGRAAAGKPARSRAKRDYTEVRAEYHRLGRQLGRLTGKRARN